MDPNQGQSAAFGDEPVPANATRRTNVAKVRKARANPDRPGERCRAEPGTFVPVIDLTRCEGKRDCTEVCPYDVFEVTRITDDDFASLSVMGKCAAWPTSARPPMRCGRRTAMPAGSASWPAPSKPSRWPPPTDTRHAP